MSEVFEKLKSEIIRNRSRKLTYFTLHYSCKFTLLFLPRSILTIDGSLRNEDRDLVGPCINVDLPQAPKKGSIGNCNLLANTNLKKKQVNKFKMSRLSSFIYNIKVKSKIKLLIDAKFARNMNIEILQL